MADFQRALVVVGIILFIAAGIGALFLLFSGFMQQGDKIAVVDLTGEISAGSSASPSIMREVFQDLKDDPSVVGVVLRIDSGGGGVIETKEIARSLTELAQEKPVVAYIGNIGASGAYYIAVHANKTMADEDSLVGSIGVISTYMVYKNLLEEKLGINTTVIKSGEFKDIGSPYRYMTDEEKQQLQGIVDTVHQEFLSLIIEKRGLTQQAIETIDTAGIFLGSTALQLGLVDSLGGVEDAIEEARTLAGSPDAEVMHIDESEYSGSDMYYSIGRGLGDSLASKIDLSKEPLQFS